MATTTSVRWTREQIAALSLEQLARLNYHELVELIVVSEVPVQNLQRIHTMEGAALIRLAHWVCRHCREQAA